MKKLWIFLIVVIIFGSVFFYYYFINIKKDDSLLKKDDFVLNNSLKTEKNTYEKKFGDMVLKIPKDFKFVVEEDDFLNLNTNFNFMKNSDLSEERVSSLDAPLLIYLNKNVNKENNLISDWFKNNSPENEPKSVYRVLKKENTIINGLESYKVVFENDTQLTGGYYNLTTIYISYKSDIYEISYYTYLLDEQDKTLYNFTESETQDAKNYEKAVEEIIKTIRFE